METLKKTSQTECYLVLYSEDWALRGKLPDGKYMEKKETGKLTDKSRILDEP